LNDKYEELKNLIVKYGYFSNGPYRLSGGQVSDYYFDLRRVLMHPRGASTAAELMIQRLGKIDAVGGMESGAIPIATAIAVKSGDVRAFFVRKAKKSHGRMQKVEGCIKSGDKVGFVEDVTTSGKSILTGIKAVEEMNCTVMKVMAVLDRETGAQEHITAQGYNFESIFKTSDFKKDCAQD
jgi:orotate phosphoribosyltransferase